MAGQETQDTPHVPLHTQRSEATDKHKQQKLAEARAKQLRVDFAITFGTEEGRRVLRWLAEQSGFGKSPVGGNPQLGMDIKEGTFYNSCRLSLYTELRAYVPEETLKLVEYLSMEDFQ